MSRFIKFNLTRKDAMYPVAIARDAIVRVDPLAGHEEHPQVPPTCQVTLANETNFVVDGHVDHILEQIDPNAG